VKEPVSCEVAEGFWIRRRRVRPEKAKGFLGARTVAFWGIHATVSDQVREFLADQAEQFRLAVRKTFRIQLGYDKGSLKALDGIVTMIGKPESVGADAGEMAVLMGAFVGETCTRIYGGDWALAKEKDENEDRFISDYRYEFKSEKHTVQLDVMGKVYKRFENGIEDSIDFFIESFQTLMESQGYEFPRA